MEHHPRFSPTSQQQLNHQTNKSEDIIKKQQKIIEELMERVGRLEGTVSAMEGELAVIRNVNTLLSRQLDEVDSYSQRSCMIVTGLWKPEDDETNEDDALNVISAVAKEAGVDENDFRKHVDKIHPIGGAKNGNQARIIKFTAHSFKEKVFLQHKRNKKIDNGKKKKIHNTSPRCFWMFSLLYHITELTCLGKPMRWLKVMRASSLLMPICMVIWSSY